jgi:hypothetical protein
LRAQHRRWDRDGATSPAVTRIIRHSWQAAQLGR